MATDSVSDVPATGGAYSLRRALWKALRNILAGRPVDNPCLLRSELLYRVLHVLDPFGAYRVNVLLKFYYDHDGGHAWLSRNGRPFPRVEKDIMRQQLTLIGEDRKYRYFVKEKNMERWNRAKSCETFGRKQPISHHG